MKGTAPARRSPVHFSLHETPGGSRAAVPLGPSSGVISLTHPVWTQFPGHLCGGCGAQMPCGLHPWEGQEGADGPLFRSRSCTPTCTSQVRAAAWTCCCAPGLSLPGRLSTVLTPRGCCCRLPQTCNVSSTRTGSRMRICTPSSHWSADHIRWNCLGTVFLSRGLGTFPTEGGGVRVSAEDRCPASLGRTGASWWMCKEHEYAAG